MKDRVVRKWKRRNKTKGIRRVLYLASLCYKGNYKWYNYELSIRKRGGVNYN
jgi:hypothetical protein